MAWFRATLDRRSLIRRGLASAFVVGPLVVGLVGALFEDLTNADAYEPCSEVVCRFQYFFCATVGHDCYGNPVCEVAAFYNCYDIRDGSYCSSDYVLQGVPCAC